MARLELNGAVALVTGAARGIGFATAKELHERGAHVCVVDLDGEACRTAAEQIGERAWGVSCDVTDRRALELLVAEIVSRHERLDVVVANAGIAPPISTLGSIGREVFDRVVAVNQDGVVNTVFPAIPHIIESKGHIVVIGSIYSFTNGTTAGPYAMSKAAVEALGRTLRGELARHGASAGVGYFGFVDTVMVQEALADPLADEFWDLIPRPLRKKIQPAEAGKALVDDIERRVPRTIRPRRWVLLSVGRGIFGPIGDRWIGRDRKLQGLLGRIEDRPGG